MKTNIEFTPDELDLIAGALAFTGEHMRSAAYSPLIRSEAPSIRQRGDMMTDLSRRIRFTGIPMPTRSTGEGDVKNEAAASPCVVDQSGTIR